MKTIFSSQPESYKQLISRSFALYRASFSKVILFSFFLSIVIFIPRLMSDTIGQDIFANLDPLSLHRLWMVCINITALVFFTAILWHMHCVAHNKHEPFIEDLIVGAKKAFSIFIAALLQSAIVFAGSAILYGILILLHYSQLLFINSLLGMAFTTAIFFSQLILLLYISTLFIFFIPLIAIENHGVFRSLENSVLVVWNHWWRVFSTQITPWIAYIALLILLKYALHIDIHIYFIKKAHHDLWTTILHIFIYALYDPDALHPKIKSN